MLNPKIPQVTFLLPRIIAVVQSVAVEWPTGLAVALKLDTEIAAMSKSMGWPLSPLGPRVYNGFAMNCHNFRY